MATHSFSCLGNPTDRGAWRATVHRVTKRVRHDLVTKQQQSFTESWFFLPIFEIYCS